MTQYKLLRGDCLDHLDFIDDNSIDSIVTDPPYGLNFMGKRWDYDVPRVEIWAECLRVLKPGGHLLAFAGTRTHHRMVVRIEDAGFEIRDMIAWVYGSGFPKSHNGEWGGTALKPAFEPITVARKVLVGTVEANWREHGTGALNIDGCRVPGEPWTAHSATGLGSVKFFTKGETPVIEKSPHDLGRWPANLIHDGSDEVLSAFPQAQGQQGDLKNHGSCRQSPNGIFGGMRPALDHPARIESDKSAARFFYCAKSSKTDRGDGNDHPTVKPTDLMRYLCRLVTPAGGVVLDPFMGSGSTGRAAMLEGFRFIGIEREQAYMEIARRRIANAVEL